MGLHICYDLSLPGTVSDKDVIARLERLRLFAETLGVTTVTELFSLRGRDLSDDSPTFERGTVQWFLRISSLSVREERDGVAGNIDDADRLALTGFLVHPGEGSESALFALVRPHLGEQAAVAECIEQRPNWYWHYCCKTQYASAISDEHLIRCHLSLVRLLEEAARLGITIAVRDETHYWKTRSEERLVAEVRNMNRIVARIAGAFHDQVTPEHSVRGAIFDHPDFERLETEPLAPDPHDRG